MLETEFGEWGGDHGRERRGGRKGTSLVPIIQAHLTAAAAAHSPVIWRIDGVQKPELMFWNLLLLSSDEQVGRNTQNPSWGGGGGPAQKRAWMQLFCLLQLTCYAKHSSLVPICSNYVSLWLRVSVPPGGKRGSSVR